LGGYRFWDFAAEMVLVRRFSTVVFSVVTLAAASCAVVAGTALPAGASEPAAGTWGAAQQVPIEAATGWTPSGFGSGVNSLSCPAAGDCTAGGGYGDSAGDEQAFVVSESEWSWGIASTGAGSETPGLGLTNVIPGLAALSTGVSAGNVKSVIDAVSCGSAGDCAAGGVYWDSAGHEQAFVVDESGGSWGTAEEVPGLAALNAGNASITSVSCSSAGNCATVGTYTDSSGNGQAYVVDETDGSWGTAQEVPGLAALDAGGSASLRSVSCASAGNCAAGGSYTTADNGTQAFVVDETGGTWGTAQEVPGSAALNIWDVGGVSSVSCASAGNCTAVGSVAYTPIYDGGAVHREGADTPPTCQYCLGLATEAFVASESSGSWGTAQQVPGLAAYDAGGASSSLSSVSCPSSGNCVAVGDTAYREYSSAIMAEESGGSWRAAQEVPGLTALEVGGEALSVSCPSAGNCAVGGYGEPSGESTSAWFVLNETGGSWGTVQEISGTVGDPYGPEGMSVSCASAGNCAAGGTQTDSDGTQQAFLVSEKPPTSSVLALSGAKVTYGDEQAERVSVTVSAETSATPSGTVTVNSGTTVVCGNIELSAGQASCTVAATKLPAGTWHLTASYSGSTYLDSSSPGLAPSTSAAQTLTVAKATSKITLALSAAKVTYGHEGSERLTVKVTGQYAGTPTAKVTVKSGTTTVCTITLAAGKGSCTLTARKLPVGTRTLTAVYGGNADFTGAASARKTLKVVT
jgi:hypothetical protein